MHYLCHFPGSMPFLFITHVASLRDETYVLLFVSILKIPFHYQMII